MNTDRIQKLLAIEDEQLKKLNQIVVDAVEEEKLLSGKLGEFEESVTPFSGRVADKVARFGGSWGFIATFLLLMLVWMAANLWLLPKPFDVYPFILLNLVLST